MCLPAGRQERGIGSEGLSGKGSQMDSLSPGSIVRCRNREWIILPSPDENLILLRLLTGSDKEVCGIYRPLANLGFDRVEPAILPLPTPQDSSDAVSTELLWNVTRLSLRDGPGTGGRIFGRSGLKKAHQKSERRVRVTFPKRTIMARIEPGRSDLSCFRTNLPPPCKDLDELKAVFKKWRRIGWKNICKPWLEERTPEQLKGESN